MKTPAEEATLGPVAIHLPESMTAGEAAESIARVIERTRKNAPTRERLELLDRFAAAALAGLMARSGDWDRPIEAAEMAYDCAEAMEAERAKRGRT